MAAKKSTEGIQPRLLNAKQVADYLSCSSGNVSMWAQMPIDPLPSFKLPHLKARKFDLREVDEWIERMKARCA